MDRRARRGRTSFKDALERNVGPPVYLHYSSSLVPKFAEVAEGIQQLSKGETLELPTEIDRTRWAKSGTPARREAWQMSLTVLICRIHSGGLSATLDLIAFNLCLFL